MRYRVTVECVEADHEVGDYLWCTARESDRIHVALTYAMVGSDSEIPGSSLEMLARALAGAYEALSDGQCEYLAEAYKACMAYTDQLDSLRLRLDKEVANAR